MQQILFHVPVIDFPISTYGMMLLTAFVAVTWWGGRRAARVGLSQNRMYDLCMTLFLTGLVGARILYMVQYTGHFADRSALGLVKEFFQIWKGGLVVYGSVFGGLIGYAVFYRLVIVKAGISGWQLADVAAPLLALGMALGRVGCLLNGCCWGQVACEECQPVPLLPQLGQFPLVPAHAREQLTLPPDENSKLPSNHALQTTTGFSVRGPDPAGAADPRSVVAAVEPGSAAGAAGLRPGDLVVEVNGRPNDVVLEVTGPKELVDQIVADARAKDPVPTVGEVRQRPGSPDAAWVVTLGYPTADPARAAKLGLTGRGASVVTVAYDELWRQVSRWNQDRRGQRRLDLVVERAGERLPVSLVPRTVTLFPTQAYETVSMALLILLLLAFQPFRRHDGQVMVLMMAGYAAHRFLNEAIRVEPAYALGLTLSQWISVGMLAAAGLLEVYLRLTQQRLPPGALPLGYGAKPADAPA